MRDTTSITRFSGGLGLPGGVAAGVTEGLPGSPAVHAELERLLGSALEFVLPGDVYGALELARRAEQDFQLATNKLTSMHNAGVATAKDYAAYDVLRRNLFVVEKRLADRVREDVAWIAGADAAARVPLPVIAPAITASTPRGVVGGVRGLGELGTAVLVVAVIIALLITLGLVAYFVSRALDDGSQRDVALLAAQAEAVKEMYGARRAYVDDCASEGRDPATCAAEAAELYPTPDFMLPMSGSGWGWVPWAIGAAGVTLLGFFAYRVYTKERGQFRGFRGSAMPLRAKAVTARPSRRSLRAPARSRYNLEVR